MRTPLSSYSLTSFSHINSDCATDCKNVDFRSRTQALSSSTSSYKFTFCSWEGCLSEPAGAISSSKAGVSLAVHHCTFTRCNSTKPNTTPKERYNAGAIYLNGISSLILSSSLFYNCCAPQTQYDDSSSGAMHLRSIKSLFSISSSDFISCFTGSSGGGIGFFSTSSPKLSIETVSDCICIQCSCSGIYPDGGGMCLWEWKETLKCTGCLLSGCSTTGNGGGLNFYFAPSSESYPVKFCFFAGNSGNLGNDVFLYILPNKETIILKHCLSLSPPTIGYCLNGVYKSTNSNWLPQTNSIIKVFAAFQTTTDALSNMKGACEDND